MNDYADRLARQAVIVSLAKKRYDQEMQVMHEIVRGTPPTYFPEDPRQCASSDLSLLEVHHPKSMD